ncbi:MAG: hypothetical protein H7258_00835 [Ferruginibacter sp.]|nr:hypothetical protein [Ferruginibacter sp.]
MKKIFKAIALVSFTALLFAACKKKDDSNTNPETISLGFMPGIAIHNGVKNEHCVINPMEGKLHYLNWDAGTNMWKPAANFATGAGAHEIAFTSDGSTSYVTNQPANTVSVVDVVTHTVSGTINVGRKPNGILIKY